MVMGSREGGLRESKEVQRTRKSSRLWLALDKKETKKKEKNRKANTSETSLWFLGTGQMVGILEKKSTLPY